MKERCVRCGAETEYDINYPVDMRRWYIEGSGQLCPSCYRILFQPLTDQPRIEYNKDKKL